MYLVVGIIICVYSSYIYSKIELNEKYFYNVNYQVMYFLLKFFYIDLCLINNCFFKSENIVYLIIFFICYIFY